jgi:hypothetical protein
MDDRTPSVPSPVHEGRARPSARHLDGRRLWSAGHAIVTCILALAIGLLLNAPGSYKHAYNQEPGWKRDLALALTGPLKTASHALLLDRPRAGLQAALGRSGEDEIDVELGIEEPGLTLSAAASGRKRSGSKAGGGAGLPVKAAPKLAFTPDRKLRLWIAGDSLVVTPGYAIRRAASKTSVVETLGVDGRIGTGLTRPDVFNWFRELRAQLARHRPHVVVLALGGNDDHGYMTGLPRGVSVTDFGDATWKREYRRRVGGLFDAIRRAGAFTVWLGLPQTSSSGQTRRFGVLNAAVLAEARLRPESVAFVDTSTLLAGPDGGFAEYLRRPSGELVKVRADDGVHFDRSGGDIIAREVTKSLRRVFDLASWKRSRASARG